MEPIPTGTNIINAQLSNELFRRTVNIITDHEIMGNATIFTAAIYPFMFNIRHLIRRPFIGTLDTLIDSSCYTIGAGCMLLLFPRTRYYLPFLILTSGIYYMIKSEKRAFKEKKE